MTWALQDAHARLLAAWRAAAAGGKRVPDGVVAALAPLHSYLLAPRLTRLGDHEVTCQLNKKCQTLRQGVDFHMIS